MKVLGIGYGRNLFDVENFEHKRLNRCAREVESFDHVVFTNKSDGLVSFGYAFFIAAKYISAFSL